MPSVDLIRYWSKGVCRRNGEGAKGRSGEGGMTGGNLPDWWGKNSARPRTWLAVSADRAGFEPFRACAIAAALPNLTGTVATTGVSLHHSVVPPPRRGSKPARDNLNG